MLFNLFRYGSVPVNAFDMKMSSFRSNVLISRIDKKISQPTKLSLDSEAKKDRNPDPLGGFVPRETSVVPAGHQKTVRPRSRRASFSVQS